MIGHAVADRDSNKKLLTPEALADYLGVPISWLYKRTRNNGPDLIPHIKLGKYVRFNPESVLFQQWLQKHQRKPEPFSEDESNIPIKGN